MAKEKVYNRIYDEVKWREVNQFNKDLMEDFLLEMKSKKKSKGTIDQYRNDLRILFIFIYDELRNKPIHELKKKQFRNYMLWLQEKNLSNARINRLMSACRSMLTFAEEEEDYEDLITSNPAQKVKGLTKESVRDIVFLDWSEVELIYNELKVQERYQEALLLALGIDSAGRKNELHQVTKHCITDNGNFTKEVIGKRNKRFRLMYNDMTKEVYKLYMEQRGEDDIDSLWISERGEKKEVSADALYGWVVSWRKIIEDKTGEYKELNVHSLRHIALELLSTGEHYLAKKMGKKFDLDALKLLAHHESVDTTNSYLRDKSEDMLLEAFGLS
ncbi:MAG: tyrosine-type recombinase/integrase [Paraclostridium sp.]